MIEDEIPRAEHLAWCKARALELCEAGDANSAFTSMASDLNKHSGTRNHLGMELGRRMYFAGLLKTPEQMRHFIEGFN